MTNTIHAQVRERTTQGELRDMRRQGKVPGVVYGKQVGNSPIMVEEKELLALIQSSGQTVVQMKLDNGPAMPVMVGGLQRDPLKRDILHVDFMQVNMREPVRAEVRIEFIGQPPGTGRDVMLQFERNTVEVRGLPDQLPGAIEADVSQLEVGKVLTAADLSLPEGIELLLDPNDTIAVAMAIKKASSEAEEEGVEEAANGEA